MLADVIKKEKQRYHRWLWISSILVIAVFIISLGLGDSKITISKILSILSDRIQGIDDGSIHSSIVWEVRMPRIFSGLLIGAGLGIAGVIFQAVLRNPLADPYTIGVSTGAAFGAVLSIYLNMVFNLFIPVSIVAFIFASITLLIILKIAGETLHSTRLILAGIIVGAIFSAGISLLKSMAGEDVSAMVFWLMGRLAAKSWGEVILLLPVIGIGIIVAKSYADDLDVLTLGISEAKSVGVDSHKRAKGYLILASLITAVCVSTSGVIGFVGLIVPHIIRMAFSAKHKYLIPLSGVIGGLVLMLSDNISRLMFQVEIPVGVITTLIGGPFFIVIYMKKKGSLI